MLFNSSKKSSIEAETLLKESEEILTRISPLVNSVVSNKALHYIGKGFDTIVEFVLYILALGCFVFMFIMDTIFPFHILGEMIGKKALSDMITNSGDLQSFNMAVRGLVALIGILFIILGMNKRASSKQKDLIQKTGNELKKLESYFLQKQIELKEVVTTHKDETAIDSHKVEPKP